MKYMPKNTHGGVATMQRIPYLDGWRGCAVLAVLFAHFGTAQGINLGRFGVELFFVLSGRLMAEILFLKRTPLKTFFPRRISRVYPALFIFCTVIYFVSFSTSRPISAAQYISAVSFTSNYSQFWIGRNEVLSHIWSLCIEEHMYIILGLLAWAHRKVALPVRLVLLVMALSFVSMGIILTYLGGDYYEVYWRTDVRGASIVFGAVMYLSLHNRVPTVLQYPWVPLVLAAVALLLNFNVVPDPVKYSLGTVALATSLNLFSNAPRLVLRFLEHPLLLRVGIWSYSIYLWQQPFAKVGGSLLMRCACFILAVTIGLISFYFVEQPARRMLNRLISGPRIAPSIMANN